MKYSSFHALLLCYKIYFELKYIARDTWKKNEKKNGKNLRIDFTHEIFPSKNKFALRCSKLF